MKKKSKRSEAAAILGNLGGTARAKRMTAEERRESAKHAAQARWAKRKITPERQARNNRWGFGQEPGIEGGLTEVEPKGNQQ